MMVVLSQILPAYYNEYKDNIDDYSIFLQFILSKSFITFVLIITSILTGLGQSLLWVAQGEYLAKSATETTLGFYFGIFWSFYMFT